MNTVIRNQAIRSSRKRRLLQCGTALPLLLAAWPALAAPVVEHSATDIAVDAASATGTPEAIDLRTTGGSITATVDEVTAAATAGQRANVTNLETADGAISASLGTVTVTGEGEVLGVSAVSQGGDINVHVGTMTMEGAITSGVQAHSVGGDVTVQGDNVLLLGQGDDVANGFFPEALLARSDQGAATVIGGTVETRGAHGSAAIAIAGTDASVTVGTAIAHSEGAVTVYAEGNDSATVDAGSVTMLGDGAAIQALSAAGTVTISADTVDSLGGGIFGRGATDVSLTAGSVDAVEYGLSGRSDSGGAVDLTVTDSVTVSGDLAIGVLARTTGDVTIDAANVSVTGPGAFPGVRTDGYRYDQGGIVVLGEGGSGAISIDAGTVDVAGEHRYGITARGNGTIDISADEVTLASADSVAVVARGGEGDVSITTGAVTTTGASGVGVFANTTTGNITIDAGITRVENAAMAGSFTGDAVVATSTSGDISITSESAYSAALWGSAIVGISQGDVSIASGVAETTGDGGAAIYGSSTTGNVSIVADQITTRGADTGAVNAFSNTGAIDLDIGTVVATGTNAQGIYAKVGSGGATIDVGSVTSTASAIKVVSNTPGANTTTINVDGAIASGATAIDLLTGSATPAPNSLWTNVNVAEGASITGTTGIGLTATVNNGAPLPGTMRSGIVVVNNEGTITGTSGTALALGQTIANVTNRGTIEGDIVSGGGMIQNRGGTIDGSVTLNSTPGQAVSVFAYEGSTTGVTGTITGSSQAVDTFAQIFTSDGTAVIGGGLPTAFDRYGVITDNSDTTVIVEAAATPVGGTPALLLMGEGSIVNRANLSATVIPGSTPGVAPQVVPALMSYGFTTVSTPFGTRFTFEGAGVGPASFTNEAEITGRVVLSTSNFANSGSIQRSSAGVPSVITARIGEAFTFSNTGTISMIDGGARVPAPTFGNPFNDFNPYFLPEPAMTIRSAVSGSLDGEGIYVPATIGNAGTIDGGLLVRMTASEFDFDNSGTITGFVGEAGTAPAVTILLGRNFDSGEGDQFWFGPASTLDSEVVTLTNSGTIDGGFVAELHTGDLTFNNTGTIRRGFNPEWGEAIGISLYQERLAPGGDDVEGEEPDGEIVTIANSGTIEASFEADLSALSVVATNSGSITAGVQDYWEGSAFSIENETSGNHTIAFTNAASGVIRANHEYGGVALEIEAEAGAEPGDEDEGELPAHATVTVVNAGTIAADNGGGLIAPEDPTDPNAPAGVVLAAAVAISTDTVEASSVTLTNEASGTISALGDRSVAIVADTDAFTLVNAGTITGGAGTVIGENEYLAHEFEGADDDDIQLTFVAGAIQTLNSVDLIENSGTITGSIDLGVGNDRLVNSGTINGVIGMGDGDDVLELGVGSIITEVADLGAGDDRVVLNGTGTNVGQVAATVNAEGLVAASGSWRAEGVQSEYGSVEIAQGATLTVVENEEGELAIETGSVQLDGALRLDLSVDETEGDLGEITIAGGGSLHLVGTATVELTDATGLQHTGGTFVENGALQLTTVYGGDVTTSGDGVFELAEGGDFTGNLVNNGTFRFSQAGDYSFLGDFSGSGLLEKHGAGTLAFDGLYAFAGTTSIQGGKVVFTGQLGEDTELDLDNGTVDLSQVEGGSQTIAQLSGDGGTVELGETQLVIDQSADTVFAGSLAGSGEIVKTGEGDLKLNGDGSSFTGTGQVDGGTLSVNGNFANASFVVNEGGTLGGAGTVGTTSVNGGTLAPGNSIDTLNVAGNVTFTAASVYEVEVDAAGNADRLNATGTATLGGARVDVLAASGTYRPLTDYTILTAAGGVSGTFGSVTSNLAFLDPSLIYSANAVTLRLVRNDIDFAAFGTTPNQGAIGNLIESFGYGNTLYNEALTLIDSDVAPSFASLTGEVYPAYASATIETAEILRRQTMGEMTGEGTYAWATGLYNQVNSGTGAGEISLDGAGVAGGLGFGAGGFSAAAGLGFLDQDRGGSQFSDGQVTFAIGRVGYDSAAGFSAKAGAQLGWVEADTRRRTTLGAIDQTVTGAIEGDYLQLFGEVSYRAQLGSLAVEPFAGISHVSADFDSVDEAGAATALDVGAIEREVTFADLGVRLSGNAAGVRPFASAAYRTAWGDRASTATVGFAGTTGTALIGAVPVAKSAAELSAGVAVTRGAVDFEVGYDGTLSKAFDSHAVTAGLKFRF